MSIPWGDARNPANVPRPAAAPGWMEAATTPATVPQVRRLEWLLGITESDDPEITAEPIVDYIRLMGPGFAGLRKLSKWSAMWLLETIYAELSRQQAEQLEDARQYLSDMAAKFVAQQHYRERTAR